MGGTEVQQVADVKTPVAVDKVRVFLSHKHGDADEARKLASILEGRTGRLKVFVSDEDITPGKEWGEWIRNTLRDCSILLLFYTDPSEEWDWCMYEAGMFTPLKIDDERLVICLHASEKRPRPLAHLETVRVVPPVRPLTEESKRRAREANDELIRFLERLYCKGDLTRGMTLNPNLKPDQLADIAVEISQLFAPKETRRDYSVKRVALEYPHGTEIGRDVIPDEVIVEAEGGSLDMFGVASSRCRWGELRATFSDDTNDSWVPELTHAIHDAAKSRLLKPITGTFRGKNDGKIYRPILYCTIRTIERPFRFYVLLSEQPAPGKIGGPGAGGTVFNLLRMSNRFRWEIVETFLADIARAHAEDEMKKIASRLKAGIRLIEEEANVNRFLIPDVVKAAFDSDEDRLKIDAMFERWWVARGRMFDAIEAVDGTRMREQLNGMKELNDEFMRLGSKRYHELCGGASVRA